MKKYLEFTCAICISLLTFLFVFYRTFYSPVISSKNNLVLNNILPQGWSFFTKSPRDIRVEVLDASTKQKILIKNSSLNYCFGLQRIPSRICIEVADLVKSIPDSLWNTSSGEVDLSKGDFIQVKSHFSSPLIKSQIIVINEDRLPWAWAKFQSKINLPFEYVKIEPL
jgi:antimicrobial peptide system SdpA family protein